MSPLLFSRNTSCDALQPEQYKGERRTSEMDNANSSSSDLGDTKSDTQAKEITGPGATSGDIWGSSPVIGGGAQPVGSGTSDPTTTGASDASNPTTSTGEEFAGSGGVGSPEYMDNLRKAHEAAGDGFSSAYGEDAPKG